MHQLSSSQHAHIHSPRCKKLVRFSKSIDQKLQNLFLSQSVCFYVILDFGEKRFSQKGLCHCWKTNHSHSLTDKPKTGFIIKSTITSANIFPVIKRLLDSDSLDVSGCLFQCFCTVSSGSTKTHQPSLFCFLFSHDRRSLLCFISMMHHLRCSRECTRPALYWLTVASTPVLARNHRCGSSVQNPISAHSLPPLHCSS